MIEQRGPRATERAQPPVEPRRGGPRRAGSNPRSPRGVEARRAARRRTLRRRRAVALAVALGLLIPIVYVSASVLGAVQTPGNESFKAKWADWLRAHHGSALVSPLENWYYSSHQPKKGGRPKSLNFVPVTRGGQPSSATPTTEPRRLQPPADLPLLVQPALPGEGNWQPTGPTSGGLPGMYVAQFRADQVFTSQITTAVWVDPLLTRVRLVPGAHEPGGSWQSRPCIGGTDAARALAAFNGGFRFQDAHGGFFAEGRQAVPLRDGAASIVIYRDGRVDIGKWGSEVTMTPDVEAVLQNLTLMVDNGQLDPAIAHNDTSRWGNTLKGKIAVARSGVGITRDGALVYVAGPALTAKSLAESLQRAGAQRAMTLDINPEWVTFNFFEHPVPSDPTRLSGAKLYPQMQRSANRYLCPTAESRDFFTISAR